MPPLINLKDTKYGRWTVLRRAPSMFGKTFWRCRCECGTERVVAAGNLRNEHSQSCGCLNAEIVSALRTTHGRSKTRLHIIWLAMWNRCTNKRAHNYKHYGARGIRVCSAWRDLTTFATWAEANGYTKNLTLDRKNNDGSYTPANCRWVAQRVQTRNSRRTVFVMHGGQKLCLTDAAEKVGLKPGTVHMRRQRGWPEHRWLENVAEELMR